MDEPDLHFKKANYRVKVTNKQSALCNSKINSNKVCEAYSFSINSSIGGTFETMSSEEAISGTRQNAARTVTDSCKYASRFSLELPLLIPFPNPEIKITILHFEVQINEWFG